MVEPGSGDAAARTGHGPDQAMAACLDAVAEHHSDRDVAFLRRTLVRRCELDDAGCARALWRTATLAQLRLDLPSLLASATALIGVGLAGASSRATDPAGLLSDLPESLATEVLGLREAVERIATIHWDALDEASAESLRTMFVALAADARVVLVTLCDRLEVIRNLRSLADPQLRQRLASETREVFAPLANRLGIWQLKWELEDLALRELEPEVYREVTGKLAAKRRERQAWVEQVVDQLTQLLTAAGIEAEVRGRPKHIASIVKKMRGKGLSFEEIYDVTAVRVIVAAHEAPGKRDCYAALGLVHGQWTPITGEFDDYIARPKQNGYQSLHTAVIGPTGSPVEVQIRTRHMHLFAEHGLAAHWAYKEGKPGIDVAGRFNLLRQLVDWQRDIVDPKDLATALKTDLFGDRVYVFTPDGDVKDLPEGATPLDFAYRVHTMVGHRCRGAKVNGAMVSLSYKLETGDRVEILTRKQPEPSRDWLSPHLDYLHTASARHKVRQWFRRQDREQAVASGREALVRELARAGLGAELPEPAILDALARDHDYRSRDDLLAAIGFSDLNVQGIAAELLERQRPTPEPEPEPAAPPASETRPRGASGVSIDGIGDILSEPARCCSPVPGDDVVGWVSRGRGIVIHRRDCPNMIHNREPERMIEIDWGRKHRQRYPVKLRLEVVDRPGVLRDVAEIVSTLGLNMRATHSSRSKKRPGTQILELELEVAQSAEVMRVLGRIDAHPMVIAARRVSA